MYRIHLMNKDMTEDSIEQVEDKIWHMTSSSHGDDKYRVPIENEV